jgi:hypothetical protein
VILSDELLPDQITDRLGIRPSRAWLRGDLNVGGVPLRHNGWELHSDIPATLPAEEHLENLLARLTPISAALASLQQDPEVVSVALWLKRAGDNWNPGLSLSPGQVEALATLRTGLEVDIYVDESRESSDPPATQPSIH